MVATQINVLDNIRVSHSPGKNIYKQFVIYATEPLVLEMKEIRMKGYDHNCRYGGVMISTKLNPAKYISYKSLHEPGDMTDEHMMTKVYGINCNKVGLNHVLGYQNRLFLELGNTTITMYALYHYFNLDITLRLSPSNYVGLMFSYEYYNTLSSVRTDNYYLMRLVERVRVQIRKSIVIQLDHTNHRHIELIIVSNNVINANVFLYTTRTIHTGYCEHGIRMYTFDKNTRRESKVIFATSVNGSLSIASTSNITKLKINDLFMCSSQRAISFRLHIRVYNEVQCGHTVRGKASSVVYLRHNDITYRCGSVSTQVKNALHIFDFLPMFIRSGQPFASFHISSIRKCMTSLMNKYFVIVYNRNHSASYKYDVTGNDIFFSTYEMMNKIAFIANNRPMPCTYLIRFHIQLKPSSLEQDVYQVCIY